jgi:hypothetical protein
LGRHGCQDRGTETLSAYDPKRTLFAYSDSLAHQLRVARQQRHDRPLRFSRKLKRISRATQDVLQYACPRRLRARHFESTEIRCIDPCS